MCSLINWSSWWKVIIRPIISYNINNETFEKLNISIKKIHGFSWKILHIKPPITMLSSRMNIKINNIDMILETRSKKIYFELDLSLILLI